MYPKPYSIYLRGTVHRSYGRRFYRGDVRNTYLFSGHAHEENTGGNCTVAAMAVGAGTVYHDYARILEPQHSLNHQPIICSYIFTGMNSPA